MAIDVNLQHVSINFTLKDHIYDVLREGILNVDIYEGDEDLRLDERQLAQQLGVSRTPIREALARTPTVMDRLRVMGSTIFK